MTLSGYSRGLASDGTADRGITIYVGKAEKLAKWIKPGCCYRLTNPTIRKGNPKFSRFAEDIIIHGIGGKIEQIKDDPNLPRAPVCDRITMLQELKSNPAIADFICKYPSCADPDWL